MVEAPLKNKVIVVTGALGLLGSKLVEGIMANEGIAVLTDIKEVETSFLNRLREKFPTGGCFSTPMDIGSTTSVTNAIREIDLEYSRIDAVVNCAYPRTKNYGRKLLDVDHEDFCEMLKLHSGGYFLVSQQMAKYFLRQGHGNILNISSIYGHIAPKFEIYENTEMTMPIEYAVIKAGLNQMTKYFSRFFKGANIRVNTISPGGIFAKQPDSFLRAYGDKCTSKGMLDPEDVVGTTIFLLSDQSMYINGQNISVDDGFSLS